jgi:Pyridoxamine 5'-phosphate oxidase
MYETADDLEALQGLLDRSHAQSTEHLRDIIDDRRVLTSTDVSTLLQGMKVVALATVTSRGEPRISAVDGHFLRGTWTWSTSGASAKARQLHARPATSISHIDGETFAVFAHGTAVRMLPGDEGWDATIGHWTAHYGGSPLEWGDDIRLYRLEPTWMVGYAFDREALRRGFGSPS